MCKYKVRWFNSKRAFFILLWNFLASFSFLRLSESLKSKLSLENWGIYRWLAIGPVLFVILAALVSGLLADTRFGNYKVAKFGLGLLFVVAVLNCAFGLIFNPEMSVVVVVIVVYVILSLLGTGAAAFSVTSLQLGLDQMPDASSIEMTSFITWYFFSLYAGFWLNGILNNVKSQCFKNATDLLNPILWLLQAVAAGLALCSNFLFANKWLIIEPKSRQSLIIIYQVLKFAAKHKAPLNRSALTYWEDKVPSRMDLGKQRYGGPFRTEQVEDVKTAFRLLVVSVPLLVITFSSYVHPQIIHGVFQSNYCSVNSVAPDGRWFVLLGTILYEFITYPLFRGRLPSIMKRIGISSFMNSYVTLLLLISNIAHHFYPNRDEMLIIAGYIYTIGSNLSTQLLMTAMLEFVCAQCPYNMRGLIVGFMTFLVAMSFLFGQSFTGALKKHCCSDVDYLLVLICTKTGIGWFGFILYCLVAHWYKRRVRDEEYSVQRGVEEVYDRYLSLSGDN